MCTYRISGRDTRSRAVTRGRSSTLILKHLMVGGKVKAVSRGGCSQVFYPVKQGPTRSLCGTRQLRSALESGFAANLCYAVMQDDVMWEMHPRTKGSNTRLDVVMRGEGLALTHRGTVIRPIVCIS